MTITEHGAAPALLEARNLIGGDVEEPAWTADAIYDPNTGEQTGLRAATRPEDVERALRWADAGWEHGGGVFSAGSLGERLDELERLAVELERRAEAFAYAHAAETGIPITTARPFAAGLAGTARGVAAIAPAVLAPHVREVDGRRVETLKLPWGPAVLYPAWNGAAFLCVTKLAYALAAGCPAVLKPSEYAQATTALLVGALVDAQVRPAAVQVVCGGPEVGARLAADRRVRMISYTGGTAGGRAVASAAIGRMTAMQLELSASNPAIVLPGADVASAADELARGTLVLNGQWCEAPRRVYVPRADHDRLAQAIVDRLDQRTVGHALDEATDVGPLAHRRQRDAVADAIWRLSQSGEVRPARAELPSCGYFVAPTVVSGLPLDAVDGEIFGPVLALSPYDDADDAIRAANALDDGLAGYVFASDPAEAFSVGRRLHAGEIRINGARVLDLVDDSAQSFWGTSGLGGHGKAEVLRAHVGLRILGEDDVRLAL
jgi:acyl-CoA reductase-like NAD-dependent aldehyde dehydrogenase